MQPFEDTKEIHQQHEQRDCAANLLASPVLWHQSHDSGELDLSSSSHSLPAVLRQDRYQPADEAQPDVVHLHDHHHQ